MIQQSLPFPELEVIKECKTVTPADVPLPWITVAPNAPYFVTEYGQNWTPIGQNDSITWPEFKGVFLGKDLATAEAYLRMLAQHGVTCVRLMLEYCQGEHRYFEKPVGRFMPSTDPLVGRHVCTL